MTSERLFCHDIKVSYLPENFYTIQNKYLATPLFPRTTPKVVTGGEGGGGLTPMFFFTIGSGDPKFAKSFGSAAGVIRACMTCIMV